MLVLRYHEYGNILKTALQNNDISQPAFEEAIKLIALASSTMDAAERMNLDQEIIARYMIHYIRHSPITPEERERYIKKGSELEQRYHSRFQRRLSLDQLHQKLNVGYRHWVEDELSGLEEHVRTDR